MLKKLVASGMIAGVAAGLIATLLQLVFVIPLIFQAELYESGVLEHFAQAAPDHHAAAPAEVGTAATPEPEAEAALDHNDGSHSLAPAGEGFDLERHGLTLLANLASYCGFGLLLAAAFGLAQGMGVRLDARVGAIWGAAGFAAFHVAAGAGLPPELPGNFAAALEDRQLWWVATGVLTAAGLYALGYGRGFVGLLLGVVLILLPQLIGAPHPDEFGGYVPPELMALYVTHTMAVAAVVWLVLGGVAGYVWQRQSEHSAEEA